MKQPFDHDDAPEPASLGLPGALLCWVLILLIVWGFVHVLSLPRASAHDRWADGSAVPSWVKTFCCGPEDVHHYAYDEVKVTPDGVVLPDYHKPVPLSRALPSQDGDYWAFFATHANGEQSEIYCLFVPPGSM